MMQAVTGGQAQGCWVLCLSVLQVQVPVRIPVQTGELPRALCCAVLCCGSLLGGNSGARDKCIGDGYVLLPRVWSGEGTVNKRAFGLVVHCKTKTLLYSVNPFQCK
jgi:hypothetical protein